MTETTESTEPNPDAPPPDAEARVVGAAAELGASAGTSEPDVEADAAAEAGAEAEAGSEAEVGEGPEPAAEGAGAAEVTPTPADLSDLPADAPIPIDPNFRIEVPGFEGPLDLLLYLIKKHQLDILDLPVSFITDRYLEYLSLMEELNLDVASEYLVMAATLAHIKSKSLLPRAPTDQDDLEEDEIDPRAELIRRLLEYQKYKLAGEGLGSRGVAGRDVFPRGAPGPKAAGPAPLADFSVFKLIDAFQSIVKRRKGELSLAVDAERITIQQRISQIVESLRRAERTPFETLFEDAVSTYDLVVTFLALLEMAKMRLVRMYQSAPEEPIYLEARVLDADAVEETLANAGADFGETPEAASADSDQPEPEESELGPDESSEPSSEQAVSDTEPPPPSDADEADTDPPPAGPGTIPSPPMDEAQRMPTMTIPAPPPEMDPSGAPDAEITNDPAEAPETSTPADAETLENDADSEQDPQP